MQPILDRYLTRLTSLGERERQDILDELNIRKYARSTLLLEQGEVSGKCYFVLQGCLRQYAIDEQGREHTSNFYTEEQAVAGFSRYAPAEGSDCFVACVEDCVVVVGDFAEEQAMFGRHGQLESMARRMMEEHLGKVQREFAAFAASSPEERYRDMLRSRPDLPGRVPQHQLASYLGMTPESLSRIKKRLQDA
ncbi:Crp/Fnr family transcriptional regulator [Saccharibacillus brassicae]|uniref:Crp/Fnr family transcriptional regulator n=1 Tax=Saccharibacillus brassicae TaxID=2583377 RepID=A0A4Y6UYS6_SACBS|nr:Crp/Fnr family transcriptional regulator [Saccharibacillus brassicae]QDH21155.1 Crp/Fnr family transcriptional regulator [Saccharibacillus brassicae]